MHITWRPSGTWSSLWSWATPFCWPRPGKGFIGRALDLPTDQRVEGTMVTTVIGVEKKASFIRVTT